MSKRKPAKPSKRPRTAKTAERVQRSKEAIDRSPKENDNLRSVAIAAIESPLKLHDDSRHEAPLVENGAGDLKDDLRQKMRDSDPKQGCGLAAPNMPAYQMKLLEIAQANMHFAFEFGLRLAAIRSPIDFFAVISEFTTRRVDMFGQHSKELAAYPFWRIEPSRELTALRAR
ncbi:Phasin protein [Bradyrhizobium sp. 195]|uniref:Phasin protein n=1 Tax=Bradyrhizobium sp. 195 TaxID=2782662 RepID=UPI00200140AF|nr:Phasin protein [Bradyrhizobium sp. 195]UPK24350.1 Phasin protein [Bradyrhizobium sp. 195]